MMKQTRGPQSIRSALWVVVLTILAGMFAITGVASGQQQFDAQAELEKTDQLLEKARDLVREFGSNRGRTSLEVAEKTQERAWDAFHRGQERRAQQMTERAREEIYRALGSVRQSEENENEVERQLERTDAVIAEARDRLGVTNARTAAQRRLETATASQRRAWELFRDRRLRPALRLTLQARETILRMAAGRVLGQGADLDPKTLEAQFERLSEAANRVESRVEQTDDPGATENWRRATELLERARGALNAGDLREAERLLRQARERLERIARTALRDMRRDEVATLVDAAAARWEQLQSPVHDAGDERLQGWYDQAGDNLQRARQALDDSRPQRALISTRKAVELLDRIEHELQP
jgi:hypothetical protein